MASSTIPLQVYRPQFTSPLQMAQQALSLRELATGIQLQQQKQQANALKLQAAQEDQNDQNTVQQAYMNQLNKNIAAGTPNAPIDYNAVRSEIAPQVRLRNLQAFDSDYQKIQQAAQQLAQSKQTTDQLKWNNIKSQNQLMGNLVSGVIKASPTERQQVYSDALQQARNAGIDVSQYPARVPDDNYLLAHAAMLGAYHGIISDAQTAADAAKAKTQALDTELASAIKTVPDNQPDWTAWRDKLSPENQARVPAVYSPNTVSQLKLGQVAPAQQPAYQIAVRQAQNIANLTPEKLQQRVADAIDPKQYPQEYQRTYAQAYDSVFNGGAAEKQLEGIIKDGADRIGRMEAGIAQAKATVPLKIEVGAGTAAAAAGVRSRQAAQSDYVNAQKDYEQAQSIANLLGQMADAARNGNKVAAKDLQQSAEAGILGFQNIRRLGGGEIGGVPGSFLDKIQGYMNDFSNGTGKLTPEVAQDLVRAQQLVADESYNRVKNNTEDINRSLAAGAQPFPVPVRRGPTTPSAPQPPVSGIAKPEMGGYKLHGMYGKMEYLGGDPNNSANWKQH